MNKRIAKQRAHDIAAGLIRRYLASDGPDHADLPDGCATEADLDRLDAALEELACEHDRRGVPAEVPS